MADKKRKFQSIQKIYKEDDGGERVYRFHVLLPNGVSVSLIRRNPDEESMSVDFFVKKTKDKFLKQTEVLETKRKVSWDSQELYLEDTCSGKKFKRLMLFDDFVPNKTHHLKLFDGSGQTVDTFENMWDLTPDTDLLTELPEDYTFETALADLIDNSLQAVWSNGEGERKLISVNVNEDEVSVFDTGPGMDGSDENSIVKWGKMGASVHRSSKILGIGGKPPYLTPFFGMFGYGGTIASIHLGRHAVVSSKTRESKKVYWLRLDRDALLKRSGSNHNWKVAGGIREPSDSENKSSPHGSFTKIVMQPKLKLPDIFQLQCKMKDIYFPYIQCPAEDRLKHNYFRSQECDEISKAGRTTTLVEFQINGINLAEVEGGEVAVMNLHSCNGPDFVLDLRFSVDEDKAAFKSPSVVAACEGNARLKCVYFPAFEGRESIERILDILKADGSDIKEDFETFCRISVRRLGRLLPEARWELLPFMKPKQKRDSRVQILKRCCSRVKCFIDTDAGFNPIPSKTDLAPHHPFTKALKELGGGTLLKEKVVKIQICRNGKQLSLQQLDREYQDWILQMHSKYDDECNSGDDDPVLLVNASNKEALGITSDVVRVHEAISRKGQSWNRGQKVKIFRGACPGLYKSNMFATIEYFLLEGFERDAGGEARILCRPLGVQDKDGSELSVGATGTNLELHSSMSLPIIVIDSGKCIPVDDNEWTSQADKLSLKVPSTIEVLGPKQCKALDIDGALPTDATVSAGSLSLEEVVAILRPSNFSPSSTTNYLDQKYILRDQNELCLVVKFKAEAGKCPKFDQIFTVSVTQTSRRGCQGLYIFSVGSIPNLFQKAGSYSFSFSLKNSGTVSCEKIVGVKASSKIKRWALSKGGQNLPLSASVGSCFPAFSVSRFDEYDNIIAFKGVPEIECQLMSSDTVISHVKNVKVEMSSDMHQMIVTNARITTENLDKIRPGYEAMLILSQPDKQPFLTIPCQVFPGPLRTVNYLSPESGKGLLPQQVVEDFKLEMLDKYKNHVKQGFEVELDVHGFSFQDKIGLTRKVDNDGFIDLSGLLKVTEGYGKPVSLSVKHNKTVIVTKKFQVQKRELRMATVVPELCPAGSKLKDVSFVVVDAKGDVDRFIDDEAKHGKSHTLKIMTDLPNDISLRYAFRQGRCIVPSIALPQREGSFCIEAVHSHHPELCVKFQVTISRSTRTEYDTTSDLRATEELDCDVSHSSDERSAPQIPHSLSDAAKHVRTEKGFELQNSEVIKATVSLSQEECDTLSSLQTRNVEHGKLTPAASSESQLQKQQATHAKTSNKQAFPNYENSNNIFKSPEGKIICVDSYMLEHAVTPLGSDFEDFESVENEILYYGSQIKNQEDFLTWSLLRRSEIQEDLRGLHAELEVLPLPLSQLDCMSQIEALVKIENKAESAAATYSIASKKMLLKDQHAEFMADVVGLVALLATAPTPMISCSLAEYLGEDQMLGIVCLSSAAITTPKNYESVLSSLAGELGRSFGGRQLFICLEDIRAYTGGLIENDQQRRLALPKPTLADGTTPSGFVGYAVNMIDVDVDHIHVKTASGHGLRETLFHHLFGDLQVYRTKEQMINARGCIENAALSLDGGIMRRKGTVSLGSMLMDVHFPVAALDHESSNREQIIKEIESKESELSTVEDAIAYAKKQRESCLTLFHEKKDGFLKIIEEKVATQKPKLSQQVLQTTPMAPAPTQSPGQ